MRQFILLFFILFTVGCSSEENNQNQDPPPFEIKQPGEDQDKPEQIDPSAQAVTLKSRFKAQVDSIFGNEFTDQGLDFGEEKPVFQEAKAAYFYKMRRNNPIRNDYGPNIIPRITMKAYSFEEEAQAIRNVMFWINMMETSDQDTVTIGEHVDAVKTPPFLVAINEGDVFMMQAACIYSGKEWDVIKQSFIDLHKNDGAAYVFETGCNAGELRYHAGGLN